MFRLTKVEENAEYSSELMKPILRMIGAWPISPTSSVSKKLLQTVKHTLTFLLFLQMLVPCLLHIFLREKANQMKVKLMAPIANSGMQFCKYIILLCRLKEFQIGLDEIRQDWHDASKENRQIFHENARMGRKMMLIVAVTMYSGGICYRLILPLTKGPIVTAENVTIRPLPCSTYFVVLNEQATPYYEVVFALQVLTGIVCYTVTSGCCEICALLVLHACSMLRILVNKMKVLVDEKVTDDDTVHRRIVDIVEYQTKIRKFLRNSQKITEYICLTETVGGTCLICFMGYHALMDWQFGNSTAIIVYLTLQFSFILGVFILYYIGQLLVDENDAVGEAFCAVNWYRLRYKHARYFVLIIAMSNYPVKLTAGKVIELSLATFSDVMKVSVGYLNILRRVM